MSNIQQDPHGTHKLPLKQSPQNQHIECVDFFTELWLVIIETFIVFEHNIFLNFPILLLETIKLEIKLFQLCLPTLRHVLAVFA